jgi:peptidyl-prolyl cis-trans isomerase D
MLDTIRRHQRSWLTYAIFLAIIVVFAVNFGPGSSSCRGGMGGTSYAAIVDGDYIRLQDFQRLYGQQLEQMRRRAQAARVELSEQQIEAMGLRQRVLDALVDQRVLANEAKRRGLKVSDEELGEYLQKVYKVDEMTEEQYKSFVERNFNMTRGRFEDERRDDIAAQKIQQLVTDNVALSDDELKGQFMRDHDRAMIEYVKFDLSGVKLAEPSAAEIDQLVQGEPKAIEERYEVDQARYRTPEERDGRVIVLKLAKDASEAEVARARSQLESVKEQVAQGADFGAVAKAQSQDAETKDKGGDLGMHKRGELPPAIDRALFSLKPDEVTKEPVRTDDGLALVQLKAVKAPTPRPLDEVKRDVAVTILRERAADTQLKGAADKLLAGLKSGKKLADLTVSEDEADKLKKGEDKPADKKPAKGAKAAAAEKPVRYESPWILKSQEAVPRIGLAPDMHKDIFALTKDAPLAPRTYKVGRAYYVVALKDRETPDVTKFEAEKDNLRDQALWSKRTEVFQDWMKHLRAQAEVQLNPTLFASRRDRGEG